MATNVQKALVALAVGSLGAMFTTSGVAMATTLTWDSSAANPTAPVDGPGTWSASAGAYANWSNGTTDSIWSNTADSGDVASFGNYIKGSPNNAGTVTLGSNITAGGLESNAAYAGTTYTIAGSGSYGLTLTGSSVVVNANLALTANTTFQQGLNLTGGSGKRLSFGEQTNTNTVGTTVGNGVTLNMSNLNSLTNANYGAPLGTGKVTVNSGGILNLSGGDSTGTLANALSISGVGAGEAALMLQGANITYNLTGPMTLVNGGPHENAQIILTGSTGIVGNFNGVIGGNGNFTIYGQAGGTASKMTINLNAAETYTGSTMLYSYAASTLVTLGGGTNTLPTGTSLDLAAGTYNNQDSPLVLDLHGNNQDVAFLNITDVVSPGSTITVEDSTNSGATLTMTGTGPGTSKPGTVAAYANIVSGGTVNFLTNFTDSSPNDGVAVFNGTTINLASGVTFSAPLNLYLAANNSDATINLNGGTLASNAISTAGTGKATLNLDGTLAMTANSPISTAWIYPNIALNVLNQGVTLNVASGIQGISDSPFLQGPNGSTGGVTISGGGTVILNGGANTYTGPTTIASGTLALAGGSTPTTIADSSLLTIKSGATFDISAITAAPTALKGLNISGGTINVAMDGSGNLSNIVVSSAATVGGSNIIDFAAASGVTALTPGTYNLLADASGGLAGTFLFGNGANSEKYLLGSDSYMLTLGNSSTAETLNIGAAAPVPEPASLGLFAVGGVAVGLLMLKRKRA